MAIIMLGISYLIWGVIWGIFDTKKEKKDNKSIKTVKIVIKVLLTIILLFMFRLLMIIGGYIK